jgi:ectoine hydroxylase-related dioxygenase (phytanoyl-CoA dioxygenase family)
MPYNLHRIHANLRSIAAFNLLNPITDVTMTTTASTSPRTLSAELLEAYRRDGYIILRGLLDAEEIRAVSDIRHDAEARAQEAGGSFRVGRSGYDVEKLVGHAEGRMALRKIQGPYDCEPAFRRVCASEKILDIVEDLIGPNIYYHSSKLMFKPPNGGRRKPWHQDFAYWSQMNTNQVTVWMAIDPSTRENGCIQVIPGSHHDGLHPHYHGEDYMIHEETIADREIAFAEMAPGDVLFFSVLTLHASDVNTSDKPRLSAIIDLDSQPKPEKTAQGSTEPIRGGV